MGKINYYLVLCLFLVISQMGYSQEEQADFFYRGASIKRKLIKYESSIFACDTLDNAMICIYNVNNKHWGKEQYFTDNTQFTEAMLLGNVSLVNTTAGQERHITTVVDNAFTEDMSIQLNGRLLMITVHINSSDGTVMGVGFTFNKGDEYETIPIGVYKNIEDEIKNNFIFELSTLAQKLNFNQLSWLQCPKGRVEATTGEETENGNTPDDDVLTGVGGTLGDKGDTTLTPTLGGLRKETTTNP